MGDTRLRSAATASLAIALVACWSAIGGAAEPTVIVLSWDGVRHDYLDRADFPALKRIEQQGVRAERLIPVFPSSTFPNHVALATGVRTDRHGIMNNVFYDRDRGLYNYSNDASWIDAEPIWSTAERQGVRAATFFWVGSETDWRGTGATYRKAPFDGDIGEAEKVDQILAWIDLPEAERPRLIMTWWHGADGVGHMKGPNHPGIVEQMSEQDAHLARLLAGIDERGIWNHTTLMIVSDHGMTEVSEVVDVKGRLEEAGIQAKVMPGAATATIFLADPTARERALEVFRQIPEVAAYSADELPDELRIRHPKRNGDLTLITSPPRTFFQANWLQSTFVLFGGTFLGWKSGMHGYSAEHPDMAAVFLSMGRGVPRGVRLGPVSNLRIAPTIAMLLGIEPPAQAEADAIGEFAP